MSTINMDDLSNMTISDKLPLVAIIPAFQPDNRIIKIGQSLLSCFTSVIVVNDGSDIDKNAIFEELQKSGCIVLTHPHNKGKGIALKTAFSFVLANRSSSIKDVITIDADGQHLLPDVIKVVQASLNKPESLTLGIRHFDNSVPFRSRFGNLITRWLFKKLYGVTLTDTQTGLRAIPISLLNTLVRLKYSRYEYELGMLIYAAKHKINIQEVLIETVYEDNNASSHFRPLTDSWRVYKVLFSNFFSKPHIKE